MGNYSGKGRRRISVKRGRVWPSWSHSLAGEFEPTEQIWTCPNRSPGSHAFAAIDLADKNLMPVKSRNRLLPAKVKSCIRLLSQCVCRNSLSFPPPSVWATLSERGIGGLSANAARHLIPHFIDMPKPTCRRKTMRARSVGERFAPVLRLLAVSASVVSALGVTAHGQLAPAAKSLPVLTHADQVRRLSPEEAGLGYPVLIRGVITMDAPSPDFFIQDATAGIYVEGSVSPKYPHLLSQLVEVEGVTGPGKFAPVIRETKLRVLGEGVLPKPQLFSLLRTRERAAGQPVGTSARNCPVRGCRPNILARARAGHADCIGRRRVPCPRADCARAGFLFVGRQRSLDRRCLWQLVQHATGN